MKQLAAARAVITIWTPNSIKSDWVRAEAGAAKAAGKLIPVKTHDLAYADIPLPFGEMHTENVGSTDLIRATTVTLLAKPTAPQSPFWQITNIFKYQVLAWIGTIGTSITVFSNLSGILDLASWAREVVRHWHEWNRMIWQSLFGWLQIKVPVELLPTFSFLLFTAMVVIGVNLSRGGSALSVNVRQMLRRRGTAFLLGALSYITIYILLKEMAERSPISSTSFGIPIIVCAVWSIVFPTLYLLLVSDERLWVLVNSLLFLFMGACLLFSPHEIRRYDDYH
jgi:hypothetical protein